MNKKNVEAKVTLESDGKLHLTRRDLEAVASRIMADRGPFGIWWRLRSLRTRTTLWLAQKITDRLDDLQFEFIGLRRELNQLSEATKKEQHEATNACSGERE